jgi:hypothetical protein
VIGVLLVVIVLIGGAAALLLRPSAPVSVADGGPTPTPTLIASLCGSGASPAPFMTDEGAGADFPCDPHRTVLTVPTPLGTIQTIVYVAEINGVRYEMMVADYGTVFSGGLTGILRGIVLDRTKASTMDEYLMKETSSKADTLNDSSGQIATAENETRAMRMKLYAVGKKLYRIAVSAPKTEIDDAPLTTFLASFVIPAEE